VNGTVSFFGLGLNTNPAGLRYALDNNFFESDRVAVVRDVFDRSDHRPCLDSVFKILSDDVTVLLDTVQSAARRRLVNEYAKTPSGKYVLKAHDINLVEYLHQHGFRVLRSATTELMNSMEPEHIPVQQSSQHLLMVAPTAFEPNLLAAEDNYFMEKPVDVDTQSLQQKVLTEFEGLYEKLTARDHGVMATVHLFTHEPYHDTPDACFPNNWFSTHTDLELGRCCLVLYPMKATNRRRERRPEFIDRLHQFRRYTYVYDMTREELAATPKFLEGTGSLVLDRVNKIAYAGLSDRTDLSVAKHWAHILGYNLIPFTALDAGGRSIYHTNVMMCVSSKAAIFCAEAVRDQSERDKVREALRATNHEVVEISLEQVNSFCGNVLEVETFDGKQSLVMSDQAYNAFTQDQLLALEDTHASLVHADFQSIEKYGGGGVRCSIGELF